MLVSAPFSCLLPSSFTLISRLPTPPTSAAFPSPIPAHFLSLSFFIYLPILLLLRSSLPFMFCVVIAIFLLLLLHKTCFMINFSEPINMFVGLFFLVTRVSSLKLFTLKTFQIKLLENMAKLGCHAFPTVFGDVSVYLYRVCSAVSVEEPQKSLKKIYLLQRCFNIFL